MKDIQKIKEFFSKPLKEESTTFKVGDKVTYLGHPAEITAVNKEMTGDITYSVAYNKGYGRTKASNIHPKSGAIKPLEEVDINDPVLMKARAAAFQRTQPKPEPVKTINPNYKAVKNADKIRALKKQRDQLMIDMEQEAEPEGGPIANRYGRELNKIDKAISMLSEGNKEYFKPIIRKDKSNPNFLYVNIAYPEGSGVLSVGGSKTMSGQDREEGAVKALAMGNAIVKKLEAKYNIEDIEVKDLKNGKVQVFAVSDDFTKMASPSLDEAKKETAVDMAKKQLDALGVKYELGNEFKPFKVIYKPIGKSDDWYDKFDEIVYLFNLESAVKQSMGEAKFMSGMLSGKDFINAKLKNYPKAVAKVNQLIDMIGESNFTIEMAEWIFDFFNNAHFESPVYEASKKEETEFHKKLDKLVHSTFGKRKDELEETVNLKASKLSSAEYQKAKKLKDFKSSDWKWNADEDLYTKVNEAELTEAYVPSNIKEFAKRKGVSSLVNKVAGWAEKVGAGIRGGTAIGYNYSTLILDMTYQGSEIRINTDNDTVTLYDEPVNSFPEFKSVYLDNKEEDNSLEERIHEALNKINEELCPAGKAYIKRRKAAGEKSSAYLSGRAVKVCKGQMSGKAKKKK
jgi:hypothetical protein